MASTTPSNDAARAVPAATADLTLPYALIVLSMLMWAGNWILGRAMHDLAAPSAMAFWRWALTAVILLPFALPGLLRRRMTLRQRLPLLFVLAMTGAGLSHWMIYTGLRHTTAINALLIFSTQPAWIVGLTSLLGEETVTRRQLAGVCLSFVGTLVIATRGDPAVLTHLAFNSGDIIIFVAMLPMALYPIMLKRHPTGLGTIETLFMIALLAALFLIPLFVYDMFFGIPTTYTTPVLAGIAYLVIAASVLAYLCFNRGVVAGGANRAGFISQLMPVFGAVMAVVFLGETVQPFHAVGVVTIFVGVFLSTVPTRRRAAP
jgi:drug/metabolite transporter (DMT)-like permease